MIHITLSSSRARYAALVTTLIACLLTSTAQAEFASRRIRYVSSYDVLNLLHKNFPGHSQDRLTAIPLKCDSVNIANHDVLGGTSVISGQPLMERPNPGLLRWLNECLTKYSKFEFEASGSIRDGFENDYFPASIGRIVVAGKTGQERSIAIVTYLAKPWTSLPETAKKELIEHMVRKMIGPKEVFQSYSPGQDWNLLLASVEKTVTALSPANATVGSALGSVAQTVFLRDEFLRY